MNKPQVTTRLCTIIACCSLHGCFMPAVFEQEEAYFAAHVRGNAAITHGYIAGQNSKLFFASAGAIDNPAVVFIHGTPGSWRDGARFLTDPALLEHARVVVIDRPGWGQSTLVGAEVEPSFRRQAAIIAPLLKKLQQENGNRGVVLVGHSLGASLAPRIAMDYPAQVNAMLLLAGSLDPKLGAPRWYNRAASLGAVGWFISPDMRRANDEIMALRAQLDAMTSCWDALRIPVTVVQGQKDTLVSPRNVEFAAQAMPASNVKIIELEDAGHLLLWLNRPLVVAATLDLIDQLETTTPPLVAASKCEPQQAAG